MRKGVILLIVVALLGIAAARPVQAATVLTATETAHSPFAMLQTALAGFLAGAKTILVSFESAVGLSNPVVSTRSVENTASAAVPTLPLVADGNPPTPATPPPPVPTPVGHPSALASPRMVSYEPASGPSPVNIFAVQSALSELSSRVASLSSLLTNNTASSPFDVQSQLAALRSAISQSYSASASPQLSGGSSNMIAAASNIGLLNGVTITNANLTASEIPALAYVPLSGGTVSGALSLPMLTASSSFFGTLTAAGTSTLPRRRLPRNSARAIDLRFLVSKGSAFGDGPGVSKSVSCARGRCFLISGRPNMSLTAACRRIPSEGVGHAVLFRFVEG